MLRSHTASRFTAPRPTRAAGVDVGTGSRPVVQQVSVTAAAALILMGSSPFPAFESKAVGIESIDIIGAPPVPEASSPFA